MKRAFSTATAGASLGAFLLALSGLGAGWWSATTYLSLAAGASATYAFAVGILARDTARETLGRGRLLQHSEHGFRWDPDILR